MSQMAVSRAPSTDFMYPAWCRPIVPTPMIPIRTVSIVGHRRGAPRRGQTGSHRRQAGKPVSRAYHFRPMNRNDAAEANVEQSQESAEPAIEVSRADLSKVTHAA